MSKDSELVRITNFIEKSIALDLNNVREVARVYLMLNRIKKVLDKDMGLLKNTLIKAKVEEYFPEDEEKVLFQEGAEKVFFNVEEIMNLLGDDFLKVATVTEASINSGLKGTQYNAAEIIAKTKITKGKKADTLNVRPMTKEEILEKK